MSRIIIKSATVLALLFVGASPAESYALRVGKTGKVLIFNADEVEVTIDASAAGAPGAADAVRAAFATWSGAGLPLRVNVREGSARAERGDGRNDIAWQTQSWEHGSDVVAITLTLFKASSGFVSESDIVFNGVDHRFGTSGDGDVARYDIQNVATHEVGHFIGLGHSEHAAATMFGSTPPGQVAKRDLDADDREALAALVDEIGRRRGAALPSSPTAPSSPEATPPSNHSSNADPDEPLIERIGDNPLASRVGCSMGGPGAGCGVAALLVLVLLLTRSRKVLSWLLPLLVALLPAIAGATVVRAVPLSKLAVRATMVVEGRVVAQRSRFRGKLIVTDHVIEVQGCHKDRSARCSRGARVVLTTLGGVVGDVGLHVSGAARPSVGQQVIVFAERRGALLRTIGLAQGLFRLQGTQARRDLSGLHLVGQAAVPTNISAAALRAVARSAR